MYFYSTLKLKQKLKSECLRWVNGGGNKGGGVKTK